jgi:hypothetical protein
VIVKQLIQTLYLRKYSVWTNFIIARFSATPCLSGNDSTIRLGRQRGITRNQTQVSLSVSQIRSQL